MALCIMASRLQFLCKLKLSPIFCVKALVTLPICRFCFCSCSCQCDLLFVMQAQICKLWNALAKPEALKSITLSLWQCLFNPVFSHSLSLYLLSPCRAPAEGDRNEAVQSTGLSFAAPGRWNHRRH